MYRAPRVGARVTLAAMILFIAACPSPLMDAIKAKVVADEAKSITSFSFGWAPNAKLYKDAPGTVDETAHAISVTVPKWTPLTGLVASFQFQGSAVTVNGVAQESGVTANDFTQPVIYTVTPKAGAPVNYTVTVSVGSQGLMGGVIQGTPLSLAGDVTTMAGKASPFGTPAGVALVSPYLYVADNWYNVIWKVDTSSGAMTVLAGAIGETGSTDATVGTDARFYYPDGLAVDPSGSGTLYVADRYNSTIRKIDLATTTVTTLAGTAGVYGMQDGIGAAAQFGGPSGLFFKSGTPSILYVTDSDNCAISMIDLSTTQVTRIAGTGLAGPADGPGLSATFRWPTGIVYYASTGNLYVADSGNNKIRQVSTTAPYAVATFAGTGAAGSGDNATGTLAEFSNPTGLAIRSTIIYVADTGNHTIRTVSASTASVSTQAGVAGQKGWQDGYGAASIKFNGPYMLAVQPPGTSPYPLYVTEQTNLTVRTVTLPTTFSSTLAGVPAGSADGTGSAARFYAPRMMTTDGSVLWIGDYMNHTLRKMDIGTAVVTTEAGQVGVIGGADGVGAAAQFNYPYGGVSDGRSIFIADSYGHTIRRMDIATKTVSTFAGSYGQAGYSDGVGSAARFQRPTGVTTDGTYLYVAEYLNHAIRRIEIATATVTTMAGAPPPTAQSGDADDLTATGGVSTASRFYRPIGITTDGSNLYVTDSYWGKIRKIEIATGKVSTLAGPSPGIHTPGYQNGIGPAALFSTPTGITTDGTFLYVAEMANNAVRKIDIATAEVTTLCGSPVTAFPISGIADGTGTSARFNGSFGIATDGVGLFVSDQGGGTIRRVR